MTNGGADGSVHCRDKVLLLPAVDKSDRGMRITKCTRSVVSQLVWPSESGESDCSLALSPVLLTIKVALSFCGHRLNTRTIVERREMIWMFHFLFCTWFLARNEWCGIFCYSYFYVLFWFINVLSLLIVFIRKTRREKSCLFFTCC